MTPLEQETLSKLIEGKPSQEQIRIIKEFKRQRPAGRKPRPTADVVRGAMGAALEGLSLGWGDEILAAAMAAPTALVSEAPYDEIYEGIRKQITQPTGEFIEEHPLWAATAMLGGGLATGGYAIPKGVAGIAGRVPGVAKASETFTKASLPVQLASAGAVGGGVAGAGSAEEGERLKGAALGVPIGAVTGVAAPAAINMGGKLLSPLASGIRERVLPPETIAMRKVQEFMPPGVAQAEMEAAVNALGDRGTLAEAAPGLGILSQGVAAKAGPHQNVMMAARQARQKGQQPVLIQKLEETTGLEGTYYDDLDTLNATMKKAAGPLYAKAYETPIDLTRKIGDAPSVGELFERDVMRKAYRAAQDRADIRGVELPELFDEDGELVVSELDMRTADWVKRGLDQVIAGEEKALGGYTPVGRDIIKLRAQYLKSLDAQNNDYAAAREAWAGSQSIIDAANKGRKAPRQDYELTEKEIRSMNASERLAYRNAMVREILDRIMEAKETGNAAIRSSLVTPKNKRRLRAAWPEGAAGDQAFDEFYRTLDNEARMSEQYVKEFLGSQTEIRRQAAAALDRPPPPDIGPVHTRPHTAFDLGVRMLERLATPHMNQRSMNDMARILATEGTAPNLETVRRLYQRQRPVIPPILRLPPGLLSPEAFALSSGIVSGHTMGR